VRLGWISLWTDIASEMSTPLIPLFLGSLLAAPGFALGLIEGGAQAMLAFLTAVSGWKSDRAGRRVPFVRWGYALAIGSKVLLAAATTWQAVLALRLVDRFGKGLRGAPRDALIVDLVGDRRGAAFGLHRAMDTAGALIGTLIAAFVLYLMPAQYRLVFALSALPGLCAIGLTLRLREAPAPVEARRADRFASYRRAAGALPRSFWIACTVLWVLALATVPESFLILWAGDQGWSDSPALLLYACFNVVYAISAYPAGTLSDRWGRRRLLMAGWSVHVLALVAALFLQGAWVAVLFGLFGLQRGLTEGVGKAWIADRIPSDLRATAMGIAQLGSGLALLCGGIVTGVLWDRVDPHATFAWGAGVGALGLLGLALWGAAIPSPHPPGEDVPRPRG
jgi:MFS family permease